MKKILSFLETIIRKKWFWIIFIPIVIIVIYSISKAAMNGKIQYVTEQAKKSDISRTVSATGTVSTSDKIDLNFKVTGKLAQVLVSEGDNVITSQVLAKLDSGSAIIQVKQSAASYATAKANLDKLLAGASREDVNISKETVANAKTAYENSLNDYNATVANYERVVSNAEIALADSKKNLDNAKNSNNQAVLNSQSSAMTAMDSNILVGGIVLNNINYNLTLVNGVTADQSSVSNCQNYRLLGVGEIDKAKIALAKAQTTDDINDNFQALNQTISALNKILISLNYLFDAVASATSSSTAQLTLIENLKTSVKADQTSISTALTAVQSAEQSLINAENNYQTQVDTYQAAVNTAQNTLNAALTNKNVQISEAKSAVDSALGAYNLAKAQYDLKVALPRNVDISYYRSQVDQARAALDLAQNQLNDYTLKAPTDGVISFVNYGAGEQIDMTKPVISMIGKSKFYIEVDVPESDIAKIQIDNPTAITLDAYSDELKFSGKVILIYPAETVIQDVVYYKIKIELADSNQYEIKTGMTANCDILTAFKKDALVIPFRAVQDKNGIKFVQIMVDNKIQDKNVTLGLRGDEGEVEILSGLVEDDNVVVFEKTQ
jgi:multidrug efflux pump subunit AcrA (membrane-fusion protein)